MAAVLNEASMRQKLDVAKRVMAKEGSRLVTKANFFSFVPPAKRPWIEKVFVPWHAAAFNAPAQAASDRVARGSGPKARKAARRRTAFPFVRNDAWI